MTTDPSTEALLSELQEALRGFNEPYRFRYARLLDALAARLSQAEEREALWWDAARADLADHDVALLAAGSGDFYRLRAALAASSAGETPDHG